MMGRRLNVFLAMLWGQSCTSGKLIGSVTKNVGRQLNRQINDIATTLAARIWVQGGKVMGFVAWWWSCVVVGGDDCDRPHT
jgi:hypothetical protein